MSDIQGTFKARSAGKSEVQRAWSNNGNAQFVIPVEITEGEHAGKWLNWFGTVTEKTRERVLQSLRYMGWSGDDVDDLEGLGSRECEIVVEMEVQEQGKNAGKRFPRVKWINRLGGGSRIVVEKPMSDAERRKFAASMKPHARRVAALPPPADESGPPPGDAPPHSDDVPF
jgi:hypothetical protein